MVSIFYCTGGFRIIGSLCDSNRPKLEFVFIPIAITLVWSVCNIWLESDLPWTPSSRTASPSNDM